MRPLNKIAQFYGTDKSSEIHNYCEKYEKYLPFNRLEPLVMLEIGVLDGKSLLTWREYFPNATIIGIDIDSRCKQFEDADKKIFVEIGSQNDVNFLQTVIDKYGQFDIILDDGSHMNNDVLISFYKLFSSIKPQGVYVVEDCTTSYWQDYGGGYRQEGTTVETFKGLIDDVNFNGQLQQEFWNVHARREDYLTKQTIERGLGIRTDIESIQFLNGIIIVTKR